MPRSESKLVEQVAKISAEKTLEFLVKEKEKQAKVKKDRRLRNTKMLLKHYRSFVIHCSTIHLELNKLNELLQIDDLETDENAVLSIKRSKERTLAIVKFTNQMLEIYKLLCERSGKPEEIRRYETIHKMYISEKKQTAEEISEGHKIDTRTVYKDIDNACKTLSSLIFGVDSIHFNE